MRCKFLTPVPCLQVAAQIQDAGAANAVGDEQQQQQLLEAASWSDLPLPALKVNISTCSGGSSRLGCQQLSSPAPCACQVLAWSLQDNVSAVAHSQWLAGCALQP
jgi:hypothetical protein